MDWTCPRCGSKTYHYDRTRIQNRCSSCGYPVDDRQQTQQLMQYDRTLANACAHLQAGNWKETVSLILPLLRQWPADVRLHSLILQAATKEFQDYEMCDSSLRTAASDAWDKLARLNGLTDEMLRYSQLRYQKHIEKQTAIRNQFLLYILIATCLFFWMIFILGTNQDGLYMLLTVGFIWTVYRAIKTHPLGAFRALLAPRPAWSANPFL